MEKLIFKFLGFNYIDEELLFFVAKILVFFAIIYFAVYIINSFMLKVKMKKILTFVFLITIQISFYFLLWNTSTLLIINNSLYLMIFIISWWVLIGKQHFPNYYTDSIIFVVSIIFELMLSLIYFFNKERIKEAGHAVNFGFLVFISIFATLYFFKQLWSKYLKMFLVNKILSYINMMKSNHNVLFENNLSVVLFSQSVLVLFSIAFSVNSSIMLNKILLIFKKYNINQDFNLVTLIELDNTIKWLQMNMLVNKLGEKELKIIVNGYKRELLN